MHAPALLDSNPASQRHADEFVAPSPVVLEFAGQGSHADPCRYVPTSHGGRVSVHAPAPLGSNPALQRHAVSFVAPSEVVLAFAGHASHAEPLRNVPTWHGGRVSVHAPASLDSNPVLQRHADAFVAPAPVVLELTGQNSHTEPFRYVPAWHGGKSSVHSPAPLDSNPALQRHADVFVAPSPVVLELAWHASQPDPLRNVPTRHRGRLSVHDRSAPAGLVSNPASQRHADAFVAPAPVVLELAWHASQPEPFR